MHSYLLNCESDNFCLGAKAPQKTLHSIFSWCCSIDSIEDSDKKYNLTPLSVRRSYYFADSPRLHPLRDVNNDLSSTSRSFNARELEINEGAMTSREKKALQRLYSLGSTCHTDSSRLQTEETSNEPFSLGKIRMENSNMSYTDWNFLEQFVMLLSRGVTLRQLLDVRGEYCDIVFQLSDDIKVFRIDNMSGRIAEFSLEKITRWCSVIVPQEKRDSLPPLKRFDEGYEPVFQNFKYGTLSRQNTGQSCSERLNKVPLLQLPHILGKTDYVVVLEFCNITKIAFSFDSDYDANSFLHGIELLVRHLRSCAMA